MKLFMIYDKDGNKLTTRNNKHGLYFSLPDARRGLVQAVRHINHKLRLHKTITARCDGVKSDNYDIVEYAMIEKERHKT